MARRDPISEESGPRMALYSLNGIVEILWKASPFLLPPTNFYKILIIHCFCWERFFSDIFQFQDIFFLFLFWSDMNCLQNLPRSHQNFFHFYIFLIFGFNFFSHWSNPKCLPFWNGFRSYALPFQGFKCRPRKPFYYSFNMMVNFLLQLFNP